MPSPTWRHRYGENLPPLSGCFVAQDDVSSLPLFVFSVVADVVVVWVFFVGHFCGVSVLGVLFLRCEFPFSINTCPTNFFRLLFQKNK